jgi:serine/threonine-protein kinase RIO1
MKKKSKSPGTVALRRAPPATGSESDRVTYRELRNTPGRVWERLAANQVLTLVADGRARAIVIPVDDGNEQNVLEAYRRGRAMMAIASMRRSARETGASAMTLAEINAVIRKTRDERRRAERKR